MVTGVGLVSKTKTGGLSGVGPGLEASPLSIGLFTDEFPVPSPRLDCVSRSWSTLLAF